MMILLEDNHRILTHDFGLLVWFTAVLKPHTRVHTDRSMSESTISPCRAVSAWSSRRMNTPVPAVASQFRLTVLIWVHLDLYLAVCDLGRVYIRLLIQPKRSQEARVLR